MSELTIDFRAVVAAVCWLAFAVLLVSVLLVVRSSALRRASAQRERDLERLRNDWTSLPRVPQKYTLEWMVLWNEARENACTASPVGGPVRSQALRWAKCGDMVERVAAITMLGHLRETSVAPILRSVCDSPNALLSIAAARALLRLDPRFAERFVTMMHERTDWAPGKLAAIVREQCELLAEPLLEKCGAAPIAVVRVLVPHTKYLDANKAVPILRNVLRTVSDAETLAAALKTLAAIGSAAEASAVARLAADERWQVRVQAANALGALGGESHIALLAGMLSDGHWWVRHRAAQAVAAVAGRCKSDLALLLPEREDPFARDALAEALAEYASLPQGTRVS